MQRIDRKDLLRVLSSVAPGLASREVIEQTSCYVFDGDRVMTYNDEIACVTNTGLMLTGAIQSRSFLELIEKFTEDTIGISVEGDEIVVHGKGRRAGFVREQEILLPFNSMERPDPKSWKLLHKDFIEGVRIVKECASRDESQRDMVCVHICKKWIEASDNFQAIRMNMKTGVDAPTLVRHDALQSIVDLDMEQFAETPSWIHFRNNDGLVLSCRRYVNTKDFPNLLPLFEKVGGKLTLPGGLAEAAEKAAVFATEHSDRGQLKVSLKPGALLVSSVGTSGWFKESRKVQYHGPVIRFLISPAMLSNISEKHKECLVTEGRLLVDGGKYRYVSCLGVA